MSGGTLCLMNDDSNWYLTILLIQNEHMIKWGKNFQRAISRLSKTFDILVPIVMQTIQEVYGSLKIDTND